MPDTPTLQKIPPALDAALHSKNAESVWVTKGYVPTKCNGCDHNCYWYPSDIKCCYCRAQLPPPMLKKSGIINL